MKKTNKKLLLALGTLTTVAAPVAAVVSCGTEPMDTHFNLLPTYTGQVDQLLALGIKPDYYPYQLDKTDVFGYISHPEKYISKNANGGGTFAQDFKKALSDLMPSRRGTSWWNQQALQDGDKGSDPEYWQHMQGNLVMYEHYLLDDGAKVVDASTAPKHYDNPHTYLQTNFRESRDPFTRMPKDVVLALGDKVSYDALVLAARTSTTSIEAMELKFVNEMFEVARELEGYRKADGTLTMLETEADKAPDKKAADGKPAPSGLAQLTADEYQAKSKKDVSWIYNDYFFASSFHNDFLDNDKLMQTDANGHSTPKASTAANWFVNLQGKGASYNTDPKRQGKNIFDTEDNDKDKQLAKLFFTATYTPEEKTLQALAYKLYTGEEWSTVGIATKTSSHHPIYEQQEDFGGAPMFEGAQRDNMLYFYNTASRLSDAFTEPKKGADPDDEKAYQVLVKSFGGVNSDRFQKALKARDNANTISVQLRTRMENIAKLVAKTHATGDAAPTFGLITLAPGEGSTTIQTMSKYSFLYNELGFSQPTPTNLDKLAADPVASTPGHPTTDDSDKAREAAKMTLFNMDDNGWWWNLGDGSDKSVATNAAKFSGQFDLGLVTANDTQYKDLKNGVKGAFVNMFKPGALQSLTGEDGEAGIDDLKVDYNLWNEGLKTPFVMNMMLDKITDMLVKKYDKIKLGDADTTSAYNWGSYWTKDYLGK